jgi:hypothetical protein
MLHQFLAQLRFTEGERGAAKDAIDGTQVALSSQCERAWAIHGDDDS